MTETNVNTHMVLPRTEAEVYSQVDGLSLQNLFYEKNNAFPNCYMFTRSSRGSDNYFDTARLSRQQARDSAISMLQEAEMDENASEDVLNEASRTLQVLASYTVAEAQIESLVTAKGYEDCVVFMGEDSCSVVVADPDGVDSTDAARIKDIVIAETGYTASQIKIMEVE